MRAGGKTWRSPWSSLHRTAVLGLEESRLAGPLAMSLLGEDVLSASKLCE
jgi:hypothetical protein